MNVQVKHQSSVGSQRKTLCLIKQYVGVLAAVIVIWLVFKKMPELGIPKEDIVFVSEGLPSRFLTNG